MTALYLSLYASLSLCLSLSPIFSRVHLCNCVILSATLSPLHECSRRPSKLGAETTRHQPPILPLMPPRSPSHPPPPPPSPPHISGGAGGQAGRRAGGVPTGPAAVSVPSRRPRPLPADLTRAAAPSRYKRQPRREAGSRRPGSCERSPTPDPPTPDPKTPDRSPGSRTSPRSSRRAGNHLRPFSPAGRVWSPGKGALRPPSGAPHGKRRLSSPERAQEGRCARTPGSSTAQAGARRRHGAGAVVAVPPGWARTSRPLQRSRSASWEGSHPTPAGGPAGQDIGGRSWELEFESGRIRTLETEFSRWNRISALESHSQR